MTSHSSRSSGLVSIRRAEESDSESMGFTTLSPAKPTAVYDTFWRFAAERQAIFFRRLAGELPPWTSDTTMQAHKFTNAYRASDRVSQFLIRHVIYAGDQSPREVFFRVMLFKLFNRIETWKFLASRLTEISTRSYSFENYDHFLRAMLADGRPIYSGAYIMPSGKSTFGSPHKHRNHLRLLELMMEDDVAMRIADAGNMAQTFEVLSSYPTIGNFLAYQFATDLNYSEVTTFSEMEFTIPGPGALDGIHKCFTDLGGLNETDIIRLVADRQDEEFEQRGLEFRRLGDRPLQLIDIQNLFCEVSKYARFQHPEVGGTNDRKRIKQRFRPSSNPIDYWYPPKWSINILRPDQDARSLINNELTGESRGSSEFCPVEQ